MTATKPHRHAPHNMPRISRDPQRLHKRSKKAPTVPTIIFNQTIQVPRRHRQHTGSPFARWGMTGQSSISALLEIFGRDVQPRAMRAKPEPWWHKYYFNKKPQDEHGGGSAI